MSHRESLFRPAGHGPQTARAPRRGIAPARTEGRPSLNRHANLGATRPSPLSCAPSLPLRAHSLSCHQWVWTSVIGPSRAHLASRVPRTPTSPLLHHESGHLFVAHDRCPCAGKATRTRAAAIRGGGAAKCRGHPRRGREESSRSRRAEHFAAEDLAPDDLPRRSLACPSLCVGA